MMIYNRFFTVVMLFFSVSIITSVPRDLEDKQIIKGISGNTSKGTVNSMLIKALDVQGFSGKKSPEALNSTGLIFSPQTGCSETDSLTVRNAHAMAYDNDQKLVMLFGGADERQVLGDLWAWNGRKWRCVSNSGPPPRTFPSLAYDNASKKLILFGGNRVLFGSEESKETFLDDMWAWNGKSWHQIQVSTPSARAEASMVYDRDRQRVVLFGGHRTEKEERIRLGDTWEWDGHHWKKKSSDGPTPRNGSALAYDSNRKRVVLFGGSGRSGDTWEWNGHTWERVKSAETDPRFNSAMAFDTSQNLMIRFGGWTREGRVRDTWSYDGTRWTKVSNDGPTGRNHTFMTYDSRRKVIVLFGGHDGERIFGDTWEWNGNQWVLRIDRKPLERIENGH